MALCRNFSFSIFFFFEERGPCQALNGDISSPQQCEDLGTELVEIDSMEEMAHLREMLNHTQQEYWVGAEIVLAEPIPGMITIGESGSYTGRKLVELA